MRVVTVPAHVPFLDECAARWLEGDAGDGVILVPGRRAARSLMEAFLRRLDGRAALLPRIVPIGDLDEDDVGLAAEAGVELPPAVEPARRLSVLTALVLRADQALGTAPTVDQAWPLARALADLMDDAERAGCDLRVRLPDAAEQRFAEHWHKTLRFLSIVTEVWPGWLEEQGVMNPVARQVALLHAQAASWRDAPPDYRVWAIGFTDGSAGVADVLDAVGRMPVGCVVLPGVDLGLEEVLWRGLEESHPQAGVRAILRALDVSRETLAVWGVGADGLAKRARMVSRALLPAEGLGDWSRDREAIDVSGVWRLNAADQQHEAVAIAMILRHGIREPGRTVALVTPDRGLARRVATELLRFRIVADDSAGEALATTPPAVFLRLLAAVVATDFAPVALLSLLKHPFSALGMRPGDCRASARLLERRLLRGPSPSGGIAGLRGRLEAVLEDTARGRRGSQGYGGEDQGASADAPDQPEALGAFLDRLEGVFAPLVRFVGRNAPLPEVLDALIAVAEGLATTDIGEDGGERIWSGEDGHVLARHLAGLLAFTDILPEQSLQSVEAFLLSSFVGQLVRGQFGLRGETLHPRVFIWGVLEARLQTTDLIVLGGLNEGIWPPATDPGPWMSRPMRVRAGLPSPEQMIGQSAHDFAALMLSAPEVVLAGSSRLDGAPAVPARWLTRFDALLGGRGQGFPVHPALSWVQALDQPGGAVRAVAPPRPMPPVSVRPRSLSVTEIETWMRDPYAIYARHVLKLRKLSPLEEDADHADFGTIVHRGIDTFLSWNAADWPRDVEGVLASCLFAELDKAALRPALVAWWRPRMGRIAAWVAEKEAARRAIAVPERILPEASAELVLSGAPGGAFRLRGRADRVDLFADGKAVLIDYKTGQLPKAKDVQEGWSSQLVLEAGMLAHGAFKGLQAAEVSALLYWRLTGDQGRGEEMSVAKGHEALYALVDSAMENLRGLVSDYDDPEQPYLSHPTPGAGPRYADYAELARVAEWSAAREE